MTVTYRTPTDADFDELTTFDGRAFGSDWSSDELARTKPTIPLDRFVIGRDGDHGIVAAGGAYEKEMTLPGGAMIDVAAVTWIAVAVTHRRQGILTELMRRLDESAAKANEPVMVLTASEGAIYRRFGYGVATNLRQVTIDSRMSRLATPPPGGSVRIVDREGLDAAFVERWDRYRATQPGELSRDADWFAAHLDKGKVSTFALHDDGFAAWSIADNWDHGNPKHALTIRDFCAATPEAHAALWHTILSVDLVGPIEASAAVAPDDPLFHLLADPRMCRTQDLGDFLWVAVRDVAAAFSARSYRTDDRLVLETPTGTFAVDADRCVATTDAADMECEADALGPLLLGGVSATELSRGGRLRAQPDVLSRADAFFGQSPLPHCRTFF